MTFRSQGFVHVYIGQIKILSELHALKKLAFVITLNCCCLNIIPAYLSLIFNDE